MVTASTNKKSLEARLSSKITNCAERTKKRRSRRNKGIQRKQEKEYENERKEERTQSEGGNADVIALDVEGNKKVAKQWDELESREDKEYGENERI